MGKLCILALCIVVQNFTSLGQTVVEIPRFSRWWPSAILDFKSFKFLVTSRVVRASAKHRTIFHEI